jgi:hypothetical protein
MPNEIRQRIARLNKHELDEVPAHWTRPERGHHLRRLLVVKGINPNRLYRVEYYPHRQCWLFTQEAEPGAAPPAPPALPSAPADEAFYIQISLELRRAALSALRHYRSQFGGKYELPSKPQELTPADLVNLIGEAGEGAPPVRFDGEGGWQIKAVGD